MLDHKTILNKFIQLELIHSIFSEHDEMKLVINAKDITRELQPNITDEYSYKNPQKNANKPNLKVN